MYSFIYVLLFVCKHGKYIQYLIKLLAVTYPLNFVHVIRDVVMAAGGLFLRHISICYLVHIAYTRPDSTRSSQRHFVLHQTKMEKPPFSKGK